VGQGCVRFAAKASHESAAYLLIEQAADGTSLYSFASDSVCLGDTWHISIKDAKAQAKYQFGCPETGWREGPPQVNGVAAVISFLRQLDC
jgi:hypothetical protein